MDLQAILEGVVARLQPRFGEGQVARYIPALARIDPRHFAISIATLEGESFSVGCADQAFSIQSISKVFTLTLALEQLGPRVWERVGREPSGTPFNSIVQLEKENGIPRNPFINAGAIAVTDLLMEASDHGSAVARILAFARASAADETIRIDTEIAASEAEHGSRNASLAYFMKSFGNLSCDVEAALAVYFNQCAIAMSARQLARSGLFLAAGGVDPYTKERLASAQTVQSVLALMLTCGHYDASGRFAHEVGLPAKSGVGGGILAIAPGKAALAAWAPGLNANGNSLLGTLALEDVAQETGWSLFNGDQG